MKFVNADPSPVYHLEAPEYYLVLEGGKEFIALVRDRKTADWIALDHKSRTVIKVREDISK